MAFEREYSKNKKSDSPIVAQYQIKESLATYTLWRNGNFTLHIPELVGSRYLDTNTAELRVLARGKFYDKSNPKLDYYPLRDGFYGLIAEHHFKCTLNTARIQGWLPKNPVYKEPKPKLKQFDKNAERKLDGSLK